MKLQVSPFSRQDVVEKSKKTNIERYGSEFANKNEDIKKRISKARRMSSCREKIKKTCIEKYGVENPFQSEMVKEKIRKTCLERFGVENPQELEETKNKSKQTKINNLLNPKEKPTYEELYPTEEIIDTSFAAAIKRDVTGRFKCVNTLRTEEFWKDLDLPRSNSRGCL